MAKRVLISAMVVSLFCGPVAYAGTSVILGGPTNSAIGATGYNNYGAAAGYAAGSAAAAAVQPAAPAAQPGGQMQNYSNMMNGQGAAYGQKDKDKDSDKNAVKSRYHYDQEDPEDPLSNVALPDRLFHNDEAHYYHGEN